VITPREAVLRTLAIAGLCGVAIVQLLALPYALVQGPPVAAVCAAAIAGALWVGRGLLSGGRAAWRGTVALGTLVSIGWLATRAVAVPGVPEDAGHWTSPVGLAGAALAVGVLALGVAAVGPRPLAATAAVGLALGPMAAIPLAALGPPPAHVHGVAASSIGPHRGHPAPSRARPAARFRPGFGGHSGHYVYANATRPHLPRWLFGVALGAAAVAVSRAAGALRRRAGLDPPGGMSGLTRSRRAALYR
jgi:hypothetical protein